MTETSTTCKNCNARLAGNFCQNCGQKAKIHQISIRHLLHDFFHALTHADKGILFLIKEMVYRPGHVAKEYIEGKRKKYFNPLNFLIITSALWAFVVLNSGYFEAMDSGNSRQNPGERPGDFARYISVSMKIILDHGKVITMVLMVPVLSFLSWLFFRKSRYSFAENLVLQSFMVGQIHLVMVLVFIPAFYVLGNAAMNNNIFQLTFLVYMVIAYRQFFRNNLFFTILKTIFILVLFIVLFWLLIFGFVFIRDLVL